MAFLFYLISPSFIKNHDKTQEQDRSSDYNYNLIAEFRSAGIYKPASRVSKSSLIYKRP